MSDDPKPPQEDGTSTPVFKNESSLNSSMITFIVDDTHFQLGSHFLQSESETLKAIIATSGTDPILLQNVTVAEFRALWRFFNEGMYDDYKPSTAEWMDLLSIANTYGLKRVHRRAVAEIGDIDVNIDPVKRVLLAKKLNVKKWLVPAYVALCTRADPIKASEAEKLGMHTFVTLVTARESIYREGTLIDRTLSVTGNLRCCDYSPSQLHDGANGAKICPDCEQIVIPGPGIQPAFTNNNRQCCGYKPSKWGLMVDESETCPGCDGTVLPAVVTASLRCCGNSPYQFTDGTNGAKMCPGCGQIVIPGPGGADFTNDNRRCCNKNPPSSWIPQPDGSEACPSCRGITLPCRLPMSVQEQVLAHVKRVFDLEDEEEEVKEEEEGDSINAKESTTTRSRDADGGRGKKRKRAL